jgi:cyclase
MRAHHHRHSRHRAQQLAERAQAMRACPPASEATLWEQLRGRKLGVQFRRQVVVGEYIADFLASEVRLIVEVDGGWHRGRERADARRQRALEAAGYRVVRLEAALVIEQLPVALARIRAALAGC